MQKLWGKIHMDTDKLEIVNTGEWMAGGHLNMCSVFGCFGAGNWGRGLRKKISQKVKG